MFPLLPADYFYFNGIHFRLVQQQAHTIPLVRALHL